VCIPEHLQRDGGSPVPQLPQRHTQVVAIPHLLHAHHVLGVRGEGEDGQYVPQLSRVVLHGRHDMIAVDEQLRHMHETQAHLTETDHNPEYNPRNICDAQSAAG